MLGWMSMKYPAIASAISQWSMIALAALLPVFFIPVSWVTVVQSKMMLVSVLVLASLGAWLYARSVDRMIRIPKSLLVATALSIPLVYTLSALVAGISPASIVSGSGEQDTVAMMFLFFATLLIGAIGFDDPKRGAAVFIRALFGGGLSLMLIQMFHIFVPSVTLGVLSGSATSIIGSWHELGIIAGLFVFLSAALYQNEALAGYWKWCALLLGVISVVMLFVVNMVDIWYMLAGVMLLYAVYEWYVSRAKLVLRRIVTAAVIGLIALIGGFGGTFIYENMPARMQILQTEVRPSWSGTFAIGMDSMNGFVPAVLGSGPNTFSTQWSLYKPQLVNATDFWNVDFNAGVGFVPTTFVTVGLLGILAWLSLFAALLWSGYRFLRDRLSTDVAPLYVAILGAALYLAFFHVLYVPTAALSLLTFLLFGIIAAFEGYRAAFPIAVQSAQIPDLHAWPNWRRAILYPARLVGIFLLVIAILIAALWTLRASISDVLVNRSVVLYATTRDAQRSLALLQKALAVYSNNDRAHRAAVELGLVRLGELVALGDTTDQATAQLQVSLETTIQHGLAAVSINNGDYQNWLALAGLYKELAGAGVQGAYESALSAYEKAAADNPSNPTPLVQIAQLNVAQNRLAGALVRLNKALELKPDLVAALYLRSQVHASEGRFQEALQDAEKVVMLAPQDALGWYNLGTIQYYSGSYANAAANLEKAIALQGDYANALFILGLTYDKLGRKDDALTVLTRVAEMNPKDVELSTIIKNIREGQPSTPAPSSTVGR